jgi:hypothetical protein
LLFSSGSSSFSRSLIASIISGSGLVLSAFSRRRFAIFLLALPKNPSNLLVGFCAALMFLGSILKVLRVNFLPFLSLLLQIDALFLSWYCGVLFLFQLYAVTISFLFVSKTETVSVL